MFHWQPLAKSTIAKHHQDCFETHNVPGTVPICRMLAGENWLCGHGPPGLHTRNLNVVIVNVNTWRPGEVMERLNFLFSNWFIQRDDVSNIDAISYSFMLPISSNPFFPCQFTLCLLSTLSYEIVNKVTFRFAVLEWTVFRTHNSVTKEEQASLPNCFFGLSSLVRTVFSWPSQREKWNIRLERPQQTQMQ